jgi:hypothetical protein
MNNAVTPEPGLIKRFFWPALDGSYVMQEEWDIDVPGCPMVRSPWHKNPPDGSIFVRLVTLTAAEYAEALRRHRG